MRPHLNLAEPDPPPFDREGAPHAVPSAAPPSCGSALDALFRRHQPWLLALLRFRYGADAAEDLLQETFLRAARHPEQAAQVRYPKAWLATLALSAARDRHRRKAVRAQVAADQPQAHADLPAPDHQHQALLLKQVILTLPPHLKEVFVLSRFAGLTYEEIAAHCGIAEDRGVADEQGAPAHRRAPAGLGSRWPRPNRRRPPTTRAAEPRLSPGVSRRPGTRRNPRPYGQALIRHTGAAGLTR